MYRNLISLKVLHAWERFETVLYPPNMYTYVHSMVYDGFGEERELPVSVRDSRTPRRFGPDPNDSEP